MGVERVAVVTALMRARQVPARCPVAGHDETCELNQGRARRSRAYETREWRRQLHRDEENTMSNPPEIVQTIPVHLVDEGRVALVALRLSTGLNSHDLINRALQLYRHVESRQRAGDELCTKSPDGTITVWSAT